MAENLCVRCGRKRIVSRKWREKVVNQGKVTYLEHTKMVCPDKNCQKQVDKKLEALRLKRQTIENDKKKRDSARKTRIVNLRLAKAKKLL